MKSFLILLLLSMMAAGVQAQQAPDSTARWSYYKTPAYNAAVKADSGVSVDPIQGSVDPVQIENMMLHQQNERLMSKESRFWGFIVLLAVGALAQAASR